MNFIERHDEFIKWRDNTPYPSFNKASVEWMCIFLSKIKGLKKSKKIPLPVPCYIITSMVDYELHIPFFKDIFSSLNIQVLVGADIVDSLIFDSLEEFEKACLKLNRLEYRRTMAEVFDRKVYKVLNYILL